MIWLFIILGLALVSQVALFFYGRKMKKGIKENVVEKYQLKTPKDAWDALANPEIPDADKEKIKKLYEGKD